MQEQREVKAEERRGQSIRLRHGDPTKGLWPGNYRRNNMMKRGSGRRKREEWVYCPKFDNVFWPELETKTYRQRKCPRCGKEHVWLTKEKKRKLT